MNEWMDERLWRGGDLGGGGLYVGMWLWEGRARGVVWWDQAGKKEGRKGGIKRVELLCCVGNGLVIAFAFSFCLFLLPLAPPNEGTQV